jgi:hypothetical protein
MVYFAIIEVDDGLTIVELEPGQNAEEAAVSHAGVLVDPGPYPSYEEASDALIALETGEDEDDLL